MPEIVSTIEHVAIFNLNGDSGSLELLQGITCLVFASYFRQFRLICSEFRRIYGALDHEKLLRSALFLFPLALNTECIHHEDGRVWIPSCIHRAVCRWALACGHHPRIEIAGAGFQLFLREVGDPTTYRAALYRASSSDLSQRLLRLQERFCQRAEGFTRALEFALRRIETHTPRCSLQLPHAGARFRDFIDVVHDMSDTEAFMGISSSRFRSHVVRLLHLLSVPLSDAGIWSCLPTGPVASSGSN
ncbi:P0 [Persimmon polerovirus]|uniref:P0 n=1 Tax=Persimmon polerovirus TaxID=2590571 RepID=A0A5K7VXY2_9VIRU|nr:P0 [Persimmon polerovirus]